MSTSRTLSVAAALALAALSGLVAGGAGFAGGWLAHPEPAPVAVTPVPEVTAPEEPATDPLQEELTIAQARVAELERTVATREGEVDELKARVARGADAGNTLRARIAALEAELADTRQALAVAESEKQQLLVQLRDTTSQLEQREAELALAVAQRDDAREQALYNRWNAFLQNAQLEICDKGNRKKLGNCRETVHATLTADARRDRYAHCIRSGQAEPSVAEAGRTDLPEHAEMIDEDAKQTRGWYVEFCDPTLPEANDGRLADGVLPPTGDAEASDQG